VCNGTVLEYTGNETVLFSPVAWLEKLSVWSDSFIAVTMVSAGPSDSHSSAGNIYLFQCSYGGSSTVLRPFSSKVALSLVRMPSCSSVTKSRPLSLSLTLTPDRPWNTNIVVSVQSSILPL
jgi:hypothetical protein